MLNMATAGAYYYNSQTKIYQVSRILEKCKIYSVNVMYIYNLLLLSRGLGRFAPELQSIVHLSQWRQ